MIPFGEWRPDVCDIDSQFTRNIRNVLPGANSYLPFPAAEPFATSALPDRCLGLVAARTSAGSFAVYAGTRTKLYKFNSATLGWDDVSRASGGDYAVPVDEFWAFAQFGTNLYATNIGDDLQVIDVDGATPFEDAPGTPPKARNIAVIGDFLVLGGLLTNEREIVWSNINDPTDWSGGLSDSQVFPDGGRVTAIAGGEVGYILQEAAIRRMRFVPGSDYVFIFERVEDQKGCISPVSAVTVAGTVFYQAEDGFYSFGPNGLMPIGAQRVNQWFRDNIDPQRQWAVRGIGDPFNARIYWTFYASESSTYFDKVLGYDWQLQRWFNADMAGQEWAALATPGYTLEALDNVSPTLEGLPYSLDSRVWQGGRPVAAIIDANGRLSFLSGSPLAAELETAEVNLVPGQRAFTSNVEPLIDTDAAMVSVGTRERRQDAVSYTAPTPVEITGWSSQRASARLQRFRVTVAAGEDWTHAQGVNVEAVADGIR